MLPWGNALKHRREGWRDIAYNIERFVISIIASKTAPRRRAWPENVRFLSRANTL